MSQHKIPNVGILRSDRSAYTNDLNVLLAKTGNLQRPEEKIVGEDSSIKTAYLAIFSSRQCSEYASSHLHIAQFKDSVT
jgi:hypothetical protein